jgi:CPSaseIIsmall: carbamoyl-phosphate synthase, small subunit
MEVLSVWIFFNNAQKAWLLLEDGTLYEGYGLGCAEDTVGELVFNTSVVGYQEILTDPANANNIVVETFPLTGNYGVNREHDLHDSITAKGG